MGKTFKILIIIISMGLKANTNNSNLDLPAKGIVSNIAIIGGGPSALSAAIYAARSELKPLVIEGEEGGQLAKASHIENWPGVPPTLGSDLAKNMRTQASELGAEFLKTNVINVNFSKHPFKLITKNGNSVLANSVIIATGTKPGKLNCPGEEEFQGKGVALCATCDGPLFKDKKIVLIGGDYPALREATILSKFTNDITIITKAEKLRGPNSLLSQVVKNPNIKILNNSQAIEIIGTPQEATGVKIINKKTKKKNIVPAQAIFIATNWIPESEIFRNKLSLDLKGRIKVHHNTATSVMGIFAAGDVTNNSYHQAPVASAFGYMAGMDAERYLKKNNLF